MKRIYGYYSLYFSDPKTKLSLAATLVILFALLAFGAKPQNSAPAGGEVMHSDEFIPDGHVLVPLELANRDALHALIGQYAVVDLFTMSPDGVTKGQRVGKRLRLIRSPHQPEQFAALVPEDKATILLGYAGPLFAVIQSRKANKGSGVSKKSTGRSRIRTLKGDEP